MKRESTIVMAIFAFCALAASIAVAQSGTPPEVTDLDIVLESRHKVYLRLTIK